MLSVTVSQCHSVTVSQSEYIMLSSCTNAASRVHLQHWFVQNYLIICTPFNMYITSYVHHIIYTAHHMYIISSIICMYMRLPVHPSCFPSCWLHPLGDHTLPDVDVSGSWFNTIRMFPDYGSIQSGMCGSWFNTIRICPDHGSIQSGYVRVMIPYNCRALLWRLNHKAHL